MSMVALRWARAIRDISGTQKFVLMMMADTANDHGECWQSAKALAEDACLSERAVRNAMDELESAGFIAGVRASGRAARWTLDTRVLQARTPARSAETPAANSSTPEPSSALLEALDNATDPGTRFRTTPERGAGVPRNVVPTPPERGSAITPINPHTTPTEPPASRSRSVAVSVELPAWLPADAWADWCQHRRGPKWSQRAAELSIKQLGQFRAAGDDPRAVIEQSIASGWQGLFAVKAGRSTYNAPSKPPTVLSQWSKELYGTAPDYDFDATAEETPK